MTHGTIGGVDRGLRGAGGRLAASEFLDAVRPSVVVISCGRKNTYGFPDEKALTEIMKPTSATV